MTFRSKIRVYALLLVGSLSLLLLLAGCANRKPALEDKSSSEMSATSTRGSEIATAPASGDNSDAQGYAGNAACADCHRQEFKDHSNSNHAHALRLMTPDELGTFAPPAGRLTNTPTTLTLANNVYAVDTDPPRGLALPLQYAFGAGKFCFTFVGVLPGNSSFELRASYVPQTRQWRPTPGQEYLNLSSFGIRHGIKDTRQCFGCHVTTLPTATLAPEKRFMGVGCESCHGPASAHVQAMRSGQAQSGDLRIDKPAIWGAKRQNEMCGRCHRTGADVNTKQPNLAVTARFQPYGLMLSRCFKESNDTLSCATCHNPHQNTSHNIRAYEAACLRCHSGKKTEDRRQKTEVVQSTIHNPQSTIENRKSKIGNVCPVNPRAGCIGCHMPNRKMLPDSTLGTFAADHFIRVNRGSR